MARGGRISRLVAPARQLAQRVSFFGLIAAAVALMVLSRTHNAAVERLRSSVMQVAAPVLDVVSRPIDAGRDMLREVERVAFVYEQNAHLLSERERLRQWQAIAHNLEQENAMLRALLQFRGERKPDFVSARVIADSGGPFIRTVLVNAGARDGVKKGQATITGDGLAGRIVAAGGRSARLLLLTDLNSRIPVVIEGSRDRAVLAGDNSDRPRLVFLPANLRVKPGDRIVTSGHGGIFPPGIPVGIVVPAGDGEARVRPFVDLHRLRYVSVLRYDLPGLNDSGARAGG